MRNSQEFHQSNYNSSLLESTPKKSFESFQGKQDLFAFLESNKKSLNPHQPFFSENGLVQDIIEVTGAEPDICLEVFHALFNVLLPQIESQSDFSFKDAWTRFIGGPVFKGSLCPPEKLIIEKKVKDIKRIMSEDGGETQIFHDLDGVLYSISNLKQKIHDHPVEILSKKEIIASLNLAQDFYLGYRNKVKVLVQAILDKEKINAACGSENDALEDLLEPKAIMMSDIFTHHWAYRISRNKAQKILSLDPNGRNLKSNQDDPATHRVTALPGKANSPLVFFKANGNAPIRPEKEFMLYSLYQNLQIPVPETALLILTNVFEVNPDYFYAVQASEAVLGESSLKAFRDPETISNSEAYISQIIGALLTNPSDGSFKNFKFSSVYQTFISIDNDLVFKPELSGKGDKKTVNVKSMLYLLPQIDLPIPETVQTLFTTLDPHLTILTWLRDLSKKDQEYKLLFERLIFQKTRCIYQNFLPQSAVPSLALCLQEKVYVDPELHGKYFYPRILISKDLLSNVIEKLQLIETILLNNRSASTQILFEEISPILGKYYRKLRLEFNDPEEALEALWGENKNNVKYSYVSSLLGQGEFDNFLSFHTENQPPETFFEEYKDGLISGGESVLDRFIRRHNSRKRKNLLNLQTALKEVRLLVQERLTNSQSIRDIVDFCHCLSNLIYSAPSLRKEITSLLSSLPHPELQWLLILEKHFFRTDRHVPKELLSSSVPILGALMKQRVFLLCESEKQYLFDPQGNIRKRPILTGRSSVTCFPEKTPEFYLKQYPEWPGYELASTLFMRLFGITQLPYQDLLIFNSKYPVLLTQKAHGDPVHRIWQNPKKFNNLDPVHTFLLIISAMLLNPEDGKEDNFILSEDGKYLTPIDNDHCFLPSTFQKKEGLLSRSVVSKLQMKTLLFCLDEMNISIPLEVKQHVLSTSFDSLLISWMAQLEKLENKLNNLVDQSQRNKFLKHGTVMRIPFYKQFIHNIHWKAHKIQDILKTTSKATPFDLLKAVEPFAARCYQDSFKQGNNIQNRFKAATHQLYTTTAVDGSRVSVLNTKTMMEIINLSEKDLQNEAMFQRMGPVDSLELLKRLVQERNGTAQRKQEFLGELDGKIQEKKWISLFSKDSKEGLVLAGSDLMTKTGLRELLTKTPDTGMKIRFLSVPDTIFLTYSKVRILAEECPNLEYLDVSGSHSLKQIFSAEGEWPLLTRLEAKDCPNLKKFVSYSPMKVLRIGTDEKIEVFVDKPNLDTFAIANMQKAFEFSFKKGGNFVIQSQGLILSSGEFISRILNSLTQSRTRMENCFNYFRENKVTVGKYSILQEEDLSLFVTDINLKNSDVDLVKIQIMTSLKLINMKRLDLSLNEISEDGFEILTSGDWPSLEMLNLKSTKMTAKEVRIIAKQSNWPQLKYLDLSNNKINDEELETLAQTEWLLLETLDLSNTGVTKRAIFYLLTHSNWTNLKEIKFGYDEKDFSKNLLAKNWHRFEELNLSFSQITRREIEVIVKKCKWPQLKHLNLSHNREIDDEGIRLLARGNWSLLEILNLQGTKIRTEGLKSIVNQTKWKKLRHLNLSSNKIDDEGIFILTQGNWPLLEVLNLNSSKITTVGIVAIVNQTNWKKLKHLNLSLNDQINEEGVHILTQGDWPLLEALHLEGVEITKKIFPSFLLNCNWPNFKTLTLPQYTSLALSLIKKDLSQLERLDLNEFKITLAEIEARIERNNYQCPQLKYVRIFENDLCCDEKISALSMTECPLLEELHLENTKITSKGIEPIATKSSWPQLRYLNTSNTHISDDGVSLLAFGEWPLLEYLNVKNTKLTSKGVQAFVERAKWNYLQSINISHNEIHDEGISFLTSGDWPFLQSLNLSRTMLSLKGIDSIVKQSKWSQLLLHLNTSNNNIFDEGLSAFAIAEWPLLEEFHLKNTKITNLGLEILVTRIHLPNLKRLDISENAIFDKGLKTLASGNWPLFQHLVYYDTKVTSEGHIALLESFQWLDFQLLEHSLTESFYNSHPSETLAAVPMYYKTSGNYEQSLLVTVLDRIWLNSKEIFLSTSHDGLNEKILLLPRDKLGQLETIKFSFNALPKIKALQTILWPPNLKMLDIDSGSKALCDESKLESLELTKHPLLESLCLSDTNISIKNLEIIIKKLEWSNLRRLDVSCNTIPSEGFKILASAKLPLLEFLNLSSTEITLEGLEILAKQSNWQTLKQLDVSCNQIGDKGLEILTSAKWSQLEFLNFSSTEITAQGITILVSKSNWPNVKKLDLSMNEIREEGFIALSYAKWPLLENLYLKSGNFFGELESLLRISKWPSLKVLDISYNSRISFEGLAFGRWSLLEVLNFKRTPMTLKDIEILVNNAPLPCLKTIDLSENFVQNNVKDAVRKLLVQRWPRVEIIFGEC